MKTRKDRRVERTRAALVNAFNELFLTRRGDIRVSDIVERANVGRSTFYEHYGSAEHLYMQALARPLAVLADAICGTSGPDKLEWLLAHFWENRQRARVTFTGPQHDRVVRILADLLEQRLGESELSPVVPIRLAALQLAESSMGLIRGWIVGEGSCAMDRLAQTICQTSALLRSALFVAAPDAIERAGE